MHSVLRSYRVQTMLTFVLGFSLAFAVLSSLAHGADAGTQAQVASAPDSAGAPARTEDPTPARIATAWQPTAGIPTSLAPTPAASAAPLPDPINEPLSFWDAVKALRRTGGFWAALAIGLATLMAAIRARAVPRPGEEEPPPTSWRARSIALLAGLGAVLGAGADMLLGLGNWAAFFTVIIASGSLIWRAINPPKSGAQAVA
jgi:hypothetical protein